MTAFDEIRRAQAEKLTDEDGDLVELVLSPGLTEEGIATISTELGFKLPAELVGLLRLCSGIEGVLETIDFTGRPRGFAFDSIFPRCISIAHDGFGNYWVLDASPEGIEEAPVFFACHDAPVILYQAPNLAVFLREVFRMNTPPHSSLVDDVHEDKLFNVWKRNPGTLTRAQAAASADDTLRTFATTLDDRYTIVDLRTAEVGMGFSWGRHGPRTEIRRYGDERVFAYAAPPKRSLWSRLVGGSASVGSGGAG